MLQFIRDGESVLVRLAGELDHCCCQQVRRELDALIAQPGVKTLILDFSALQFMDSSGIGVMLGRYRLMRDKGGAMAVIHMNPLVTRIFRMAGLDRVIRNMDASPKGQNRKMPQEVPSR